MDSQPNCHWLVLVPTPFELARIQNASLTLVEQPGTRVELCGFGPIVPAAKSTELIQILRPKQVLLMGIAGAYNGRLKKGAASTFHNVGCFGVGVGSNENFQSAGSVGWNQWSDGTGQQTIGDLIELNPDFTEHDRGTLVTATACSGSSSDVEQRISMFENAVAEDMEGFAVAVACKMANIRLTIVRGISNDAGDRNKTNWCVDDAILAATLLAEKIIKRSS